MEYIMGIDIGTTGCKATVFDRLGQIRAQAYEEYPIEHYTGTIDPEMVWEKTKAVIKECTAKHPEIKAVSTTSFGESVVAVDSKQQVLCDSYLYTSGGVTSQWQALNKSFGSEKLAKITGHISHPMYTINRLMWYRDEKPDIYTSADKFLFFSAFILMKLSKECMAEDTQAARSLTFDVHNNCWSREILSAAGIDPNKMPKIKSAGDILGTVPVDLAAELGFSDCPQVVVGGQDQPCVALGMGAIHGGDAVYGLGTVECLSVVLDGYTQTEKMLKYHLICAPHVIKGKFLTYGVLYSGGNVTKEIRNRFYGAQRLSKSSAEVYDLMFREMTESKTDLIFVPHISGSGTPYMNQNDFGTLMGLRVETNRGEILRSALQGLAFDMRLNIENMEACGIGVSNIRATGGGAKSMDALKIRATAMNQSLFVPNDVQAGTRGVFLIAAKALGWIDSFENLGAFGVNDGRVICADEGEKEDYNRKYRQYLAVEQIIRNIDFNYERTKC